jgi:hypothetical protein
VGPPPYSSFISARLILCPCGSASLGSKSSCPLLLIIRAGCCYVPPRASRGVGGSMAAVSPLGEKPPRVWCVGWGGGAFQFPRCAPLPWPYWIHSLGDGSSWRKGQWGHDSGGEGALSPIGTPDPVVSPFVLVIVLGMLWGGPRGCTSTLPRRRGAASLLRRVRSVGATVMAAFVRFPLDCCSTLELIRATCREHRVRIIAICNMSYFFCEILVLT